MIDVAGVSVAPSDALRLLVVPVFAWAAWRDVRTRRVPNLTWLPLALLGAGLFAWEAWTALSAGGYQQELFTIRATVSLGVVVPLAYLFWRIGGFGGADAKALMVLALLFPSYPVYYLPGVVLPLEPTPVGVFSLTALTNTVVLGAAYPLALVARNALAGRWSPAMAVGRPVGWRSLATTHGRLLETPEGLSRSGVDLDALRMYLDWRRASLSDLREHPGAFRESLPDDPGDPGGGAVTAGGDGAVTDGGEVRSEVARATASDDRSDEARAGDGRSDDEPTDPWGAAAFLAACDGGAYGTTPDQLRDGLELVANADEVWMSPGIPFLVPTFLGLLVGLVYGDLLYAAMTALGLA